MIANLPLMDAFEVNALQVAVDSLLEQQQDLLLCDAHAEDEREEFRERCAVLIKLRDRLSRIPTQPHDRSTTQEATPLDEG